MAHNFLCGWPHTTLECALRDQHPIYMTFDHNSTMQSNNDTYLTVPISETLSLDVRRRIRNIKIFKYYLYRIFVNNIEHLPFSIQVCMVKTRAVVLVSTSRSRDVPTSRLGLVSRKIVNVSVSSRSRPFTSRAQDQLKTITIDTELTCTAMVPVH